MSVFTMDHVNQVSKMDLAAAKEFVKSVINGDDTARPATKAKAISTIMKQRSVQNIANTMCNWILAHPDEGLKVIKC